MKKTVLYNEIDGHKIVIGFDVPTVDSVETNKIVNAAIVDTDEFKAAEAKKSEYNCAVTDMKVASRHNNDAKYKEAAGKMSDLQTELKPIALALKDKIISLKREKAVYFEPRIGEVITGASEAKTLLEGIQGLAQGELMTLDGSVVRDDRGKVYFSKVSGKWAWSRIVSIGEAIPSGVILATEVTTDQRDEIERDRIAVMTADDKAAEKDVVMGKALNTAAGIRSRLEIQGDKDALKKSKKLYDDEAARIKKLYK